MACKRSRTIDKDEYEQLIKTIASGGATFRPNEQIATILTLEANLGLRISDILQLKLDSIIFEAGRYHLNYITEKKTRKMRNFLVPVEVVEYIRQYAKRHHILYNMPLFSITQRAVNKHLAKVADYLGYEDIGTHSFRKFFATTIYLNNNYNIVLVQQLLQHSTVAITQRYIGISDKELETALQNHIYLPNASK